VKNSFSRVVAWFPLLGNNKKTSNYFEHIIILAVPAAVHNFVMNMKNLSYAAYKSPEMQFQQYFKDHSLVEHVLIFCLTFLTIILFIYINTIIFGEIFQLPGYKFVH
jgi:hypothetical protein